MIRFYTSTTVALASKYPIKNLHKVDIDFTAFKNITMKVFLNLEENQLKPQLA